MLPLKPRIWLLDFKRAKKAWYGLSCSCVHNLFLKIRTLWTTFWMYKTAGTTASMTAKYKFSLFQHDLQPTKNAGNKWMRNIKAYWYPSKNNEVNSKCQSKDMTKQAYTEVYLTLHCFKLFFYKRNPSKCLGEVVEWITEHTNHWTIFFH